MKERPISDCTLCHWHSCRNREGGRTVDNGTGPVWIPERIENCRTRYEILDPDNLFTREKRELNDKNLGKPKTEQGREWKRL